MKVKVSNIFTNLSNIFLTIFLFLSLTISFALGENSSIGKYVLLSCLLLVFIFYLLGNKGVIKLKIKSIHIYMIAFIMCCFLSASFATNTEIAISKTIDIIEIFLMVIIAYLCFQDKKNIDSLLKIIMWSGYLVTYYSILYYGWDLIKAILSVGYRIGNEALNANTLGMCAAYSIIITIYYMLYDKIKWWNVVAIPAIAIIAVSGSRKALIVVLIGSILLFILKNFSDKNAMRAIFKTFLTVIVISLLFYLLLQLSMFSTLLERIQKMMATFLGNGEVDSSSLARIKLVNIGKQLFLKSPFVGVGIDNPKLYTYSIFKIDNYYLHNNYIELLAGVGLIGTIIYYSIYGSIFIKLIKYRNFTDKEYNITLALFLIKLIMDIGQVSYDVKLTYFYLLIFYIKANTIESKNKVMK